MTQPAAAPSQSRSLHEDVAVAHDGEAIPMVRVGEKQSGNEFLRLSEWLGYCSCGLAGRLATAAWKGCEVVCGRDGQRLVEYQRINISAHFTYFFIGMYNFAT